MLHIVFVYVLHLKKAQISTLRLKSNLCCQSSFSVSYRHKVHAKDLAQ